MQEVTALTSTPSSSIYRERALHLKKIKQIYSKYKFIFIDVYLPILLTYIEAEA